jgi:hypothetical protein
MFVREFIQALSCNDVHQLDWQDYRGWSQIATTSCDHVCDRIKPILPSF